MGLNAPDGAGCFPTEKLESMLDNNTEVSMHLMVLGASRRTPINTHSYNEAMSQCA